MSVNLQLEHFQRCRLFACFELFERFGVAILDVLHSNRVLVLSSFHINLLLLLPLGQRYLTFQLLILLLHSQRITSRSLHLIHHCW